MKVIQIVVGALVTFPKDLEKNLKEFKISKRMVSIKTTIPQIGQNTQESPGDLRRLAVTQTNAAFKNSKGWT